MGLPALTSLATLAEGLSKGVEDLRSDGLHFGLASVLLASGLALLLHRRRSA